MAKFRKKPVVIEAFQWFASTRHSEMPEALLPLIVAEDHSGLAIRTLEGTMIASPGDWIIRGVKGEFYPCKPDIFAASYEPANDAEVFRAGFERGRAEKNL